MTVAKLIYDIIILIQQGSNSENAESADANTYFDMALRVIQIIGYGYGYQAHSSKDFVHAQIFIFYVCFSYLLIAYNAMVAFYQSNMVFFVFDSLNLLFNMFMTVSFYRFTKYLKGSSHFITLISRKRQPEENGRRDESSSNNPQDSLTIL